MEKNKAVTGEKLEKDLEAIEAEKEAFLKGKLKDLGDDEDSEADENDGKEECEEVEEDVETEETEFSLTEDEIEEWIAELTRLKEDKEFILLEIDETTNLKINYAENSEEESEEDRK